MLDQETESLVMENTATISLPDRLKALLHHCEVYCSSDCCGIDAFDFSPLHIAPYAASYASYMHKGDPTELSDWEAILDEAADLIVGLIPDTDGLICSVAEMNHTFTRPEFETMLARIRHGIKVAPQLIHLARALEYSADSLPPDQPKP